MQKNKLILVIGIIWIVATLFFLLFPFATIEYFPDDYYREVGFLFSIFLLFLAFYSAYVKYTDSFSSLTSDDVLKLIGISGALFYFLFQLVFGFYTSGLEIKLECRKVTKNEAMVKATVKKSGNTSIRLYDVVAFTESKDENFHFKNIEKISVTKPSTLTVLTSAKGKIQLNPTDSIELTKVLNLPSDSNRIVYFYILGKTIFNLNIEQWSSSCYVEEEKKNL
jgi:hypothetical protein